MGVTTKYIDVLEKEAELGRNLLSPPDQGNYRHSIRPPIPLQQGTAYQTMVGRGWRNFLA